MSKKNEAREQNLIQVLLNLAEKKGYLETSNYKNNVIRTQLYKYEVVKILKEKVVKVFETILVWSMIPVLYLVGLVSVFGDMGGFAFICVYILTIYLSQIMNLALINFENHYKGVFCFICVIFGSLFAAILAVLRLDILLYIAPIALFITYTKRIYADHPWRLNENVDDYIATHGVNETIMLAVLIVAALVSIPADTLMTNIDSLALIVIPSMLFVQVAKIKQMRCYTAIKKYENEVKRKFIAIALSTILVHILVGNTAIQESIMAVDSIIKIIGTLFVMVSELTLGDVYVLELIWITIVIAALGICCKTDNKKWKNN